MRSLLAAATLAVASCALLEPQAADVDAIVADALKAARGPHSEQKVALGRARTAFEKSPGDASRLRLATLLAVLPPPLRDDARAGELLEPLAASATPFGRFAALLSAQISERQRITREHDRADKERDKREEALRQQLDAVQSIERGIIDRQEKLRRQTPNVAPKR